MNRLWIALGGLAATACASTESVYVKDGPWTQEEWYMDDAACDVQGMQTFASCTMAPMYCAAIKVRIYRGCMASKGWKVVEQPKQK